MKIARLCFVVLLLLLLGTTTLLATEPVPQVARPDFMLYGPEQAAFNAALTEVYFDKADNLAPSAAAAFDQNVKWLNANPNVVFYINGYCDWREDVLYNMTLSQKRADVVKARLLQMGVAPNRILMTVGWGKLYPNCVEQSDDCFQKNRRVRLVYSPSAPK